MNIVFVGVQGSGKGTQAKRISKKMGLCAISTGALFRDIIAGEESLLKEKLDAILQAGQLVDGQLAFEILMNRLQKPDCQGGVLFDGYPRNLAQAELLDSKIVIDHVVEINISDDEALKRLSGRVNCEKCGEGFNLHTAPQPTDENICDFCGGKLVRRTDDNPESIKKRIATYHKETEPLLDHYKDKLIIIDGERTVEEIATEILEKLQG